MFDAECEIDSLKIQPCMSIGDRVVWNVLETPIGALLVGADGGGVVAVHFEGRWDAQVHRERSGDQRALGMLRWACEELDAYFAGALQEFRVPCIANGTPFQRNVWNALREIPFGAVTSYRAIARRIGNERSVRAVGAANGANPIPIIIPCHRIIGSDGTLTGFGGGLERKQWLLEHEGAIPASLGIGAKRVGGPGMDVDRDVVPSA